MTEQTPIRTPDVANIAPEQEPILEKLTFPVAAVLALSRVSDKALELASEHPLVTQALQLASQLSLSSEQGTTNPFITAAIIGGVAGVAAGAVKSFKEEEKSIKKTVGYMLGGAAVGAFMGEFVFISGVAYGVSKDH